MRRLGTEIVHESHLGVKYLDRYEKLHYLGEDVDRASDDDEETRHRRWSARALHSVPLTYNHSQHNVAAPLGGVGGRTTYPMAGCGGAAAACRLRPPAGVGRSGRDRSPPPTTTPAARLARASLALGGRPVPPCPARPPAAAEELVRERHAGLSRAFDAERRPAAACGAPTQP
ncbi:AT-rich interactive domain-containing protein 2 [Gryllus bimaculatus]|nr:AT-rich interactive domain-containing protein 2 [Gryllus bimaculatus]